MESAVGRPEEHEVRINAADDAHIFEALFSQCFQGIYRFVFARLQDRETAEDLTSETFLRAWRSWPPRTVVENAPKAWLFQIARHLVTDYYRAISRRRTAFLRENLADKGGITQGRGVA